MVKNLPANAGDVGSILVSERSPGGGNGNPRRYSCLGNPIDSGIWRATVHGFSKSWTQLNTHVLPKLLYRFSAIPVRISADFFVEINKMTLKFI